jgi:hypothetical protein
LRKAPYEVRRLGWGTFTLEAEIVLKEPYGWIVDNSGVKQPGLELTWTLDFEGRGRQGRVRAKVKRFEEAPTDGRRVLRSRTLPLPNSSATDRQLNEEEDEDDDPAWFSIMISSPSLIGLQHFCRQLSSRP